MAGLVELATPSVDAQPGEESEVQVLVYNTGAKYESYDLELTGSVSPWAFLDPAVVRLLPGDSGTVRLVLRPPRTGDLPAGPMPFSVRLRARADPDAEEVVDGTVDLVAFESFTARLEPPTLELRTRGRARVDITNDGNIPIVVRTSADSPDGALAVKLAEDAVLVPAATSTSLAVMVKPTHRRLLGKGTPASYTVRLESMVRVASLSGRAQPKGSLPAVLLRGVLAGILLLGLVAGARSYVTSRPTGPARSKKGLPKVIGNAALPAGPDVTGPVGVEEAPPVTPVTVPAPGGGPTAPVGPVAPGVPLRRFFDPALSDYVYSADAKDAVSLGAAGLVDQGAAGKVLSAKTPGTVPLYRVKKPDGRHVFTFDEAERRALVSKGAVTESTTGYLYPAPAPGTTPLFRMSKDGVVYLTADNGDVQARLANGWVNEGIRGYVLV